MNNKSNLQHGFSAAMVVLALAALGLVGYIGWRVYEMNKPVDSDSSTVTGNDAIDSAEDLDEANDELNSQDIDAELETSDIDATLSE